MQVNTIKKEDLNKPSFFMGTIMFKILFMSETINAVNVIFINKCPIKTIKYSAYGINWLIKNKIFNKIDKYGKNYTFRALWL